MADVAIFCAGVEGAFAIDDAYVVGRIAARTSAVRISTRTSRGAPRSVLDLVPRIVERSSTSVMVAT
jgi:phosphosulfolactate phosphohydrolase-like enzyme